MTNTQVVLAILVGVSGAVALWGKAAWLRVALAVVLLGMQCALLSISFDARARQVLAAEIEAGRSVAESSRAVRLVNEAQLTDRISVAMTSLGLFLLVVLGRRTLRDTEHQRSSIPETSQEKQPW